MILVTGATGLVGTHLLITLIREKQIVRALYRTENKREHCKKVFLDHFPRLEHESTSDVITRFETIVWVQASINDIPNLEKAFLNVTHVYHCAALISFNISNYQQLRKTNIEGTANVVNLAIKHQIQKLCYVSSIATLGASFGQDLINETSEWNPEDLNSIYAITKYGGELEVWRASQEGLSVVIVNPGVIIGPGFYVGGSGSLFSKIYNGMPFYTSGSTGFVGINDVITIMIQLMKSNIINERYILVSENLSYKNMLQQIANVLHKKSSKYMVSTGILNLFRIAKEIGYYVFRTQRNISKATIRSLTSISKYSNQKITSTLHFEFEPIAVSIQKTAKDFLKAKKNNVPSAS